MQKDRKSKLAQAFMARRKKQLACYVASTLTIVASTSLSLPFTMAFDAPPANSPANLSMGQVQVGSAGKNPVTPEGDQISSSDVLKRVGIRFVGPENANKHHGSLAESRSPNQQLARPTTVIQPPMVISGASTGSSSGGSNASSVEGIRIRIPSEMNSKSNPTSSSTSTAATPTAISSPNLKMTVGTGVTTQPINNATSSVSTPKPTFAELPSTNALTLPPMPSTATAPKNLPPATATAPAASQSFGLPPAQLQVAQQATQALAPLPKLSAPPASTAGMSSDFGALPLVGSGKIQEKLQANSAMTSRAPGIVRIPSIVVTSTSPSLPMQSLPTQSLPTPSAPSFVRKDAPADFPMDESAKMSMASVENPSFESSSTKRFISKSVSAPASLTVDASFQRMPSTVTRPATLPHNGPAMNSDSLALSTNRPTELPEPRFGSPISSSSSPKLMEAAARTAVRHEPSIVPVALMSTPKNDLPPNQDALEITEAFENKDDSKVAEGPSAPAAPPSTIAVALKNVQMIRLPGKVLQVEIEDDTICRVISTEPNTLTIIGATVGDSKITVWSTNPTTRASDSQDFRISVREMWGQAAKNSVSIDDVNQSIAALFPGSEIVLKPNSDGSISVQGTATSNESAKQILMLVRKMFLVPVQDRIAIANL